MKKVLQMFYFMFFFLLMVGIGTTLSSCKDDSTKPTNTPTLSTSPTETESKTEFEVIFDSQGGTNIEKKIVLDGEKVSAPEEPSLPGYTFAGWYLDAACSDEKKWDFATSVVTSNVTLYAKWVEEESAPVTTYTVTFDPNGGEFTEALTVTVDANSPVDVPATSPIKIGEEFMGWQLDEGVNFDFTTPITENITLKAFYDVDSREYKISFNTDGGSVVEDITGLRRNEKASAPVNPTKLGFDFVRWNLDGHEYDFDTPVTKNITLVAVWEVAKVTVTFNSDGGSLLPSQTLTSGSTAVNPGSPNKVDAEFIGWFTVDGEAYDFSTPVTQNIELVAHWDSIFTVTFLNPDAAYTSEKQFVFKAKTGETITEQFNQEVALTNPNALGTSGFFNDNFVFLGWFEDGSDVAFNPETPITRSITLKTRWEKYFVVSFGGEISESIEEQIVAEGEYATRPEDPIYDNLGHEMDDWYFNGVPFDFENTPITGNTTVFARFKYSLSFNSVGGSEVETQIIPYGQYGVRPNNPVKEHYHFLGWFNSGSEYHFEANAITGDITLTAQWVYVFNGSGSEEDPYLLQTPTDVLMMSELINKDAQDPITGAVYQISFFELVNDIDLDGSKFTPISLFGGVLRGNGYTISNFTIETANNANVGFFSELDIVSEVSNLKLKEVSITGDKATDANIGLLAGFTDAATIYGVEASGQICLNYQRMERAIIGGLVGRAENSYLYANSVDVQIQGGNIVGGLVGYATNDNIVACSYVTDNSTLQLYRTGDIGLLAGRADEGSIFASCYTLATIYDSNYTVATDSNYADFGFGAGAYVNCHHEIVDNSLLSWNSSDWNVDDMTLNQVTLKHDDVNVEVGHYDSEDNFVLDDTIVVPFGQTVELNPVEGLAGYCFVGYRLNGSNFNEDTPVYADIRLVAYYSTYEDMLGRWFYGEGQWFDLEVANNQISAKASIYTGEYEITGSQFGVRNLTYKNASYETIEYITFDMYGYASITGNYYDTIVLYFVDAFNEQYRAYLQRVPAGDFDKAFMRLERLIDGEWVLENDQMAPEADEFNGYYINERDYTDRLFIKAPYIPSAVVYNPPYWYEATDMNTLLDYSPFLYYEAGGEEAILGFTLLDSDTAIYEFYFDGEKIHKFYDYGTYEFVDETYYESYDYMNGRWFSSLEMWNWLYSDENTLEFNPGDEYYVYEEESKKYNYVVAIDEELGQITVNDKTYTYTTGYNSTGSKAFTYVDEDGITHSIWADYEYSMFTGVSFVMMHEAVKSDGTIVGDKAQSWEKYDVAMMYTWVEDMPEVDDVIPGFGDIILTSSTIQLGNNEPVEYDYVYITDCDGIPGMEITSFDYLRFTVNEQTFYIREHTTTGYVYLHFDNPNNPGHFSDKRYVREESFVYYDEAYVGNWISRDEDAQLSIDVDNKTINGNPFEYVWYQPTAYDNSVIGNSAKYYTRVANFTMDGNEYQFRATYVRDGYGYLFVKNADGTYELVDEYFSMDILDKSLGHWEYYHFDGSGSDVIDVTFDETNGYSVYYNGVEQEAHIAWNVYNAIPALAFKLDDGEKVELLHLVYSGEYGYDLLDVLDYESYSPVYDESEEDMVYEYTNKYLYFKDSTIKDVVKQMSGTWTDGAITVTIKNDEIYVIEPGYEPITLSIAYTYDLPNSLMEQYVVIMVGIDGEGHADYMFYYYNYYLSMTHFLDEETSTGGSLVNRNDAMVFRGNYTSVSLNEKHDFAFDGVSFIVDGFAFDVEYLEYGYAQMLDGTIVPVVYASEVADINDETLTAVLRSIEIYAYNGVLLVTMYDTAVTLGIFGGEITIESYDTVTNILTQEIFYSTDVMKYNGVYEFVDANGNQANLALNDGYSFVNGNRVEADIIVLASGDIQIVFEYDENSYYGLIAIDPYGNLVYQIFLMSLVS